jgi:hypothetical protein
VIDNDKKALLFLWWLTLLFLAATVGSGLLSLVESLCITILIWLQLTAWTIVDGDEHHLNQMRAEFNITRYNEIYPSIKTVIEKLDHLEERLKHGS